MLEKRVLKTRNSSRLLVLMLAGILALVGGTALAADTDIVVTEIMQNPAFLSDTVGEWFEVYNGGATPVDLNGWTIKDNDSDSHVIAASAIVPAMGYAVLARDSAAMAGEGVTAIYQYSSFFLANGDDEVVLLNASLVEIDRPDPAARSPALCIARDAASEIFSAQGK